MTSGVSKKLCISLLGIQAIVQMSNDAAPTDKIWYALMIVGIVAVFKIIQAVMDWKKPNA